jgi:hypothetical protein
MKKLSILLVGLLLVTGFAFAQDVEVDFDASVTWGIDLNTQYTGFMNDASSSVTITWLDEADYENGGSMDDMYGSISLTDVSFGVDGTGVTYTAGSVEAKIVISPAEITIYSAPSFDYDLAPTIETVNEASVATTLAGANTIGGITITIPVDPITVGLNVASDGDWTDNSANDYVIGADVELAVDPATVTLGFTYGFLGAPQLGVSALVELALADVASGLDAWVGFDGNQPDGGSFDYDMAAGATIALTEDNADGDSADVSLDTYLYFGTATPDPDVDIQLGFAEPEAGGIMDMLYADATVQILDVLATLAWNVDVSGGYDTGDIDPYFGFGYGSDSIFDVNVGVHLKEGFTGIDLTTITLDYVSTDVSTDNGIFTVEAAVAF